MDVLFTCSAPKSSKRLRTPGAADGGVMGFMFMRHLTASMYSSFSFEASVALQLNQYCQSVQWQRCVSTRQRRTDHSFRTTTFSEVQAVDTFQDDLSVKIDRILCVEFWTSVSNVLFVNARVAPMRIGTNTQERGMIDFILC